MSAAEKISITLTPEMNRIIKERVESGQFASTSELIREALRAWHKQEVEYEERIASIRDRIKRSIDDPRASIPIEQVFEGIRKLHKSRQKKAGG
jgi:antitoxin ParD1/3/4